MNNYLALPQIRYTNKNGLTFINQTMKTNLTKINKYMWGLTESFSFGQKDDAPVRHDVMASMRDNINIQYSIISSRDRGIVNIQREQ